MTFGLVFGLITFGSLSPQAQAQSADMRFEVLAADEKAIVDLLAADFYEETLRTSQASAIEQRTGELYQQATPAERAAFRETRRASWKDMSDTTKNALHDQKRPAFANLTEEQKAPFRTIALDKLGHAGALDEDALYDALAKDI